MSNLLSYTLVTVTLPLQVYHVGSLVIDGGWVHVHHGCHWIQGMIWDGENWESEQSPFLDPSDCHIAAASILCGITGRGWRLGRVTQEGAEGG